MEDFKRTFLYRNDDTRVTVDVSYKGKRLSFSGNVYKDGSGYSGGQCYKELLDSFPQSAQLVELWIRWHLNDLCAGDEVQEAYLRALELTGVILNDYVSVRRALHNAGILTHNGYEYGTKWLTEDVPEYVLQQIKSMKVERI